MYLSTYLITLLLYNIRSYVIFDIVILLCKEYFDYSGNHKFIWVYGRNKLRI